MEKKYESDMSRREKWEQQKETLRGLKGKKKLEYLWSYYKSVLVIVLALVLVLYTVGVMVRNGKDNLVLTIVVVDAAQNGDDAAEKLEKEILDVLGAEGKYDCVEVVLSANSVQTEDNIAKLRVALSTVGEADLVVCGESVYQEYSRQGAFADAAELLGADASAAQSSMTGGVIDLTKCPDNFLSKYVDYSPAYLCVTGFAEHTENAAAVLQEILQ